jgi:hypothetical protein
MHMKKQLRTYFGLALLFVITNSTAATYYLNPATGDDSNNGQTAGTAWQNWGFALGNMNGGDELIVVNGTYNDATAYMDPPVFPNFPANNPVLIRAQSPLGVILTGGAGNGEGVTMDGLTGYVWQDFEIANAPSNVVHLQNCSYITFRNCKIHDANLGGDGDVVKVNQCNHIGFEGCEIYNPSERSAQPEFYQECFDIVDADDSYLKNCWVHHVGGRGTILAYCKGGTHNNVFEGCVFGPQSTAGDQPAVLFGGHTDSNLFQAGEHFESENMTMRNNIFYRCIWGAVGFYDVRNSWLYNNLMFNCGGRIRKPALFSENEISQGIMEFRAGNADSTLSRNVYIRNNIFYDTDGDMPALLHDQRCHGVFNVVTSNNCYWNAGKAIPVCGLYNPSTEANALWQQDPLLAFNESNFTSYSNIVNGFNLANNSAAWNSGYAASTLPMPGVTTDIHGLPRSTGTIDIGPWELQTTAGASSPTVLCMPSVILTPTKDTWINAFSTTDNYGSDEYLRMYGGYEGFNTGVSSERRTPLIRFDLSAIPANSVILKATLILTPDATQGAESSNGCVTEETNGVMWIEPLTRDFTEGTGTEASPTTNGANWTTYNGSSTWTVAGGDADTNNFVLRYNTIYPASDPRFAAAEQFDITPLAQLWVNNTLPNYGLLMRVFNGGKYYWSMQAPTSTNRPRLEICYGTLSTTEPATGSGSLNVFPNPAGAQVQVTFPEQRNSSLIITDLLGKTVLQQTVSGSRSTLETGNLPEGIYVIKLAGENGTVIGTTRFVKSTH